jgi:hypothetical protein
LSFFVAIILAVLVPAASSAMRTEALALALVGAVCSDCRLDSPGGRRSVY